jgi:hypothetical protein
MTATSRRSFLVAIGSAAAGAAALTAVAQTSAAPTARQPAAATGAMVGVANARSLEAVLAEADRTAGRRLLGSPWRSRLGSPGPWSAVYATWLLRENGVPGTPDVSALYGGFAAAGGVGNAPRPGALIFYNRGDVMRPTRVGLVTSVTDSVAQCVEGDHPMTVPYDERFVRRFARPYDERVRFGYPVYA